MRRPYSGFRHILYTLTPLLIPLMGIPLVVVWTVGAPMVFPDASMDVNSLFSLFIAGTTVMYTYMDGMYFRDLRQAQDYKHVKFMHDMYTSRAWDGLLSRMVAGCLLYLLCWVQVHKLLPHPTYYMSGSLAALNVTCIINLARIWNLTRQKAVMYSSKEILRVVCGTEVLEGRYDYICGEGAVFVTGNRSFPAATTKLPNASHLDKLVAMNRVGAP